MPAVWVHFLLLLRRKQENIQANSDALLIKAALSCKTSPYWEYKRNTELKWTKRMIINNDKDFAVTVEPGWIYSALKNPYKTPQNHHNAMRWQAVIYGSLSFFLSFFMSLVYFNQHIYQHLSGSFYLGRKQESNYEVGSKNWSLFWKSWTFDLYLRPRKSNVCFWDASAYFKSLSDNPSILGRQIIMRFCISELHLETFNLL